MFRHITYITYKSYLVEIFSDVCLTTHLQRLVAIRDMVTYVFQVPSFRRLARAWSLRAESVVPGKADPKG